MFKTAPARVKAAEDDNSEQGVIEALVATYDVDSGGDQIVPGAFTKTLEDWQQSGQSIPFIWSHMHDDLDAYLGDVIEASETDEGLLVKAQIDLDDEKSRKAYRLLKGGRVRNYSFAYEVLDAEEKDGVNLLKQIKLFEVGPTLIGMNQSTRTLVVKAMQRDAAAQLKAGRVISAANEQSLREASDAIARVLSQLDSQPEADEPSEEEEEEAGKTDAQPAEPSKADERARVKADDSTTTGAADDDLLLEVQLLTQKGISS